LSPPQTPFIANTKRKPPRRNKRGIINKWLESLNKWSAKDIIAFNYFSHKEKAMRRAKYFFMAFVTACFFVGCAGMQQNSTTGLTDDFAWLNPQIPIEEYSYIQIPELVRILSIDDIPFSSGFIRSGYHSLHVRYASSRGYSDVLIRFTFKAGKSYRLKYNIDEAQDSSSKDTIRFFVAEDDNAHNDLTKLKAYQAYQKANPNRLQGTWIGEKKRLLNTFYMRYVFDGRKIIFEGKNKHAGMRPFVAEGRLVFNENTIILIPEQAHENGEEAKNFEKEPIYIWRYSLLGDLLQIEGGRLFGTTFIWENTGEFRKVK
jgi:hypothetical protein